MKNKEIVKNLYGILLIIIGIGSIFPEHDITVFVLFGLIGLFLLLSKER